MRRKPSRLPEVATVQVAELMWTERLARLRAVAAVLRFPFAEGIISRVCFRKDWSIRREMASVNINQGESIESALRRFKRKVMTEEIIKDAKKHAFFMSKGQKAKLKSALARKRNKKKRRPPQPQNQRS
jgi:small subunit ribosomal protein S21